MANLYDRQMNPKLNFTHFPENERNLILLSLRPVEIEKILSKGVGLMSAKKMETDPLEPDPAGARMGIYVLCGVMIVIFVIIVLCAFWPGTRSWIRSMIRGI